MAGFQRSTIFGGEAERYDRFRPSYPAEIIDRLVEHRPAVAVDAGCGTGKAARLVVERDVAVVGVEPDHRMAGTVALTDRVRVVACTDDWLSL
jgi:trans-aconitate methyltransferase